MPGCQPRALDALDGLLSRTRQERGAPVQRMSALDASFLLLEDASTTLHMGSLAIFEGPAPSHEEFHALVRRTLPLSPPRSTL